jgi:prenyltransferase beta subunit
MTVAQKLCRCKHGVFIIEHYFAWKSFSAVSEALISVYPDKEVRDKTTVRQLVTKLQTQEVFVCDKCSCIDKAARITAVPILRLLQLQHRDVAPRIQYSHSCPCFVREGVHVSSQGCILSGKVQLSRYRHAGDKEERSI